MNIDPLLERWRGEAERLRELGQENLAAFEERIALDLEEWLAEHALEALTVAEAARESGYSESALYSMVAEERIENIGTKGCPRVRRCDAPRKPGHGTEAASSGAGDENVVAIDRLVERERAASRG